MRGRVRQRIDARSSNGDARATTIELERGTLQTPIFMPVGTVGSVKGLTTETVRRVGAQIILGNTYHLYLRPGTEVLSHFGGLHRFMDWNGPILTDSGGYQFFSLRQFTKTTDDGVQFRSHIDGSRHVFTPEKVIQIQAAIDSDIMMVLDDCPALPATQKRMSEALRRTTLWARRSIAAAQDVRGALFGIVQGGTDIALRQEHLAELAALPFDGLALGGLAVGEAPAEMYETLEAIAPSMPEDRPRYLMGVGRPQDLIEAIHRGIDMFDCVMPTRNARNGQVFTRFGKLNLKNARFKGSDAPMDPTCSCTACSRMSAGYMHHLFRAGEMLGPILATEHNLSYYLRLVKEAREAIQADRWDAFRARCYQDWDGESS